MILMKPSTIIEDIPTGNEILNRIEKAGRTCYKSEDSHDKQVEKLLDDDTFNPDLRVIIGDTRRDKAHQKVSENFVRMLLNKKHESTIEHVSATVRFIVDRGVTHELVRHRLASFSQESTRYVDYTGTKTSGHCQFIIPPWCDLKPGVYTQEQTDGGLDFWKCDEEWVDTNDLGEGCSAYTWLWAMHDAERYYQGLRSHAWTPQQARSVLPNSTKTEIVVTANMREWRKIFELRASEAAHPQMREVMIPLLNEFKARVPVLFEDIFNTKN